MFGMEVPATGRSLGWQGVDSSLLVMNPGLDQCAPGGLGDNTFVSDTYPSIYEANEEAAKQRHIMREG